MINASKVLRRAIVAPTSGNYCGGDGDVWMLLLLLIVVIIVAGVLFAWLRPSPPRYPPPHDVERDHDLRRKRW